MKTFIKDNKAEILKAIIVLLPLVGLGGLSLEQQKENERLRQLVVVEHEPIEVTVGNEHSHALQKHSHPLPEHTHPEFQEIKSLISEWH